MIDPIIDPPTETTTNSSQSKSLPHDSAVTHVQGASEYIDDRQCLPGEVHLELFLSPHAHAEIVSLDFKEALASPGVLGIFSASDFSHLHWGTIFQDQPLLAKDKVHFVGEPIAIVAGETKHAAKTAAEKIKGKFRTLPAILTIEQAIKNQSFIGTERTIQRSDLNPSDPAVGVKQALQEAKHVLEGKIVLRGAEHFYLENQACIAYPKEGGQIEIHSSAQHPTEIQHVVAHALGISYSEVTCIVKRMGGAFGGKESQGAPFAAYAALVASKLNRPARLVLTKDDDMLITGKRNPFENQYRVGFDSDGKIQALSVKLYSDGGAYADLSTAIMERAMLHCDNAYFLPNVTITGQVTRTHLHPHTAFRGFGGPKGVATIEKILEEIAHFLGKDALDMRRNNVYRDEQNITPYGQKFEFNFLPALFNQLEKSSDYRNRRKKIQEHNQRSADSVRGLSLTAVKFGISFTTRFLNQANALVNVHRDGSVQVSTGATEMGQGVNTRIAQIVAEELGLPPSQVRVMTTSTEKNANTSPTAASSGTDLNGAAALQAARAIKLRLITVAKHLFSTPKERWARNTAGLGTEMEVLTSEKSTAAATSADSSLLSREALRVTNAATESELADFEFRNGTVRDCRSPAKTGNVNSSAQPTSATISFADLCNEAYLNRVSLSEYAHFKFPGLSFNKLTGKGDAFFYFTQGVAASEVEIDRWSGEVKVRRVDILMDLGRPINEALDVGQIEGGFVQGMGWMTTEKLHYDGDGRLRTVSPSTYKIPNVQDTPRDFRVALLDNPTNTKNVRGSKAVGEPPLLLSISVYTAICDALKSTKVFSSQKQKSKSESSNANSFPLEIPATGEQVLRIIRPELF